MVASAVREGGDITYADMVMPPEEDSEIQKFFADSSVFITGGTGYLGKLILEKLLRSCPDVKRIYILVREKKGKDNKKRFEEIFETPIFDVLKRKSSNFTQKVSLVSGDCTLPDLGLDEDTKNMLYTEINCVFHCAATVRFDEAIKKAAYINVRATRDLLMIAKKMKHLRAFIHVSTAFSHCVRKDIEEKVYQPKLTGDKLLTLVETLDEDTLNKITDTLLDDYPNTYVLTKSIAEEVIQSKGKGLPVAIVRPSIVIATVKEPVAGWIDNVYGATGALLGAALGLIRTIHGNPDNYADVVPADFVIHCCIAAAWNIANIKSLNDNQEADIIKPELDQKFETEIPVFNYVSSPQNGITWRTYIDLAAKHAIHVPTTHLVWHSYFRMRHNKYLHLLCVYLLHYLPAYVIDFLAKCLGKKPMLVEGYRKIDKFCLVISYFALRQWNFSNKNTQALWQCLNTTDKELFDFNMAALDWETYYYTYVRGIRLYLLKDPLDTIPQGEVKLRRVRYAHYTLVTVLVLLLFKLLHFVVSKLFF